MTGADDDILHEARLWTQQGRSVVLATVIETWGSAPRPVGSHLAIDGEGRFLGSVSGGCVEGEVIAQGQEMVVSGAARAALEFGVADETAWRAGLSCGGRIRIFLRPFDPALAAAIEARSARRRVCAVLTELASGAERLVDPGEAADEPLPAQLRERLAEQRSGLVVAGDEAFFLRVHAPSPRLVAVGAVHIAQSLAPMARIAGFEAIVVDPRSAFASPERFPDARLLPLWPKDALAGIGLDAATGIVLLTHEPRIDDEALALALRSECFYIGALGSRKTHARRVERMLAAGFGAASLQRVHAPVGLAIGAQSPAEIAVAILGEAIAAFRGRLRPLGDAAGGRAA